MSATDATPLDLDRRLAIAIRIQCPSPECGAVCSAAEAASGQTVKCPKCGKAYLARPTFDGQKGDTARHPPSPSEDPFPTLPAEFGRYRVLQLLGRGGMGAVFLAEDSQLGRRVALKIPFFDAKASPQRLERFAREARSAAGLTHPNICTVYDTGEIGGRPFLTMRYVKGTSLEAEIERADGVSQARAAEVARQVALALDFAHRAGVVHRDLKPANVMVAADGEPVVMDFGLAKLIADADPSEAKLTRDGGVIGTPSYMSPEQIRGDAAIGPASDIYSLGVMLFELLTGQTPYRGSVGVVMGQALAAPVRSVWELSPDADPRLETACRRAMAKDPAARFATMAAFAEALDAYLKAPNAPPPPAEVTTTFDQMVSAPAPARPKPKTRRPVGVALAVALALVAVGASAAVVLRLETKDGALLVEIDDPEVEARLKGGTLTLCGPDGKVRYTLTAGERDKKLPAGPYTIRVEGADGLTVDTPEFTLKRGEKVTVKVTLERKAVAAAVPTKTPSSPASTYRNSVGMEFALVPKGKSWLGGAGSKVLGDPVEFPQDFYLGKYPVTQAEWVALMGSNPSHFSRAGKGQDVVKDATDAALGRLPVEMVTWDECQRFVALMNEKSTEAGWVYRLPTEAEWEYACRGGPQSDRLAAAFDFYFAKPTNDLPATQANFDKRDAGRTSAVDAYPPNRLGLHDLHGNVHQYCDDAGRDAEAHVLKGGSLWSPPGYCRAASKLHNDGTNRQFTTGLRLARVPGVTKAETGFVPLFSGKDLAGWEGLPGLWNYANGTLTGATPKALDFNTCLCSKKAYKDFELTCKVRIKNGSGNSGIQVRSALLAGPQFRVQGPQADMGGEYWGSLYGEADGGMMKAAPKDVVDRVLKSGDFNDYSVRVVGRRVTITLNGAVTVDDEFPTMAAEGIVGFQLHAKYAGQEVTFKDILIREVREVAAVEPPKLPATADGFVPLFNGKDLTGWKTHPTQPGDWVVRDGKLVGQGDGASHLYSVRADYGDTHLRARVRLTDAANSGLHARCTFGPALPDANPAYPRGYECDLGYNRRLMGDGTGSIYYGARLPEAAPNPPGVKAGEWFTVELVCRGPVVTTFVNGREAATFRDPNPPPAAGHVAVGFHTPGAAVEFESVEVKDLPPVAGNGVAAAPGPVVAAADPDRKAAEYALSVGGTILLNGKQEVKAPAALPKGRFDLTRVLLRDCAVSDAGLAACAGVAKLNHLDLVNTAVTDRGLASFKDCPLLYVIDLNATATTDAGLAHFHHCKGVGFLWLGGTKVTDKGLAGFAGCRGVLRLDLRDTGAGDAGLASFKDCAALEFLNLDGSKVTDAALATLKGFPKLANLYLSRTPLTAKGVAAIRAALPGCKVTADNLAK